MLWNNPFIWLAGFCLLMAVEAVVTEWLKK